MTPYPYLIFKTFIFLNLHFNFHKKKKNISPASISPVRDLISHTYFQDETEFNYSVCVTVSLFRLVDGKINKFFDMKSDV